MASFAATPAPFVIHTASNISCSKVDLSCRSDKLMYDHMHLKVVAIAAIILASLIGVVLPLVTKNLERRSNYVYFVGRSFAAGIILATGFVHMLPQNVFDSFTNPCLPVHSWAKFLFAGCVAMVAMVFTLVANASASAFYLNKQASWAGRTGSLELEFEGSLPLANRPRLHIQYPHHEHTSYSPAIIRSTAEVESSRAQIIRLQSSVIAQVVEIGTIAHYVIVGMLLGASQSPCTIRPLLAALCFHQMFQGLALGGCIAKAGFRNLSAAVIMAFFFCITTPGSIAIGIGIASVYNQKCSPRTLIIAEGLFDSMSASGILVYMALVDLVAHEFLSEDLAKQPLRQVVEYLLL